MNGAPANANTVTPHSSDAAMADGARAIDDVPPLLVYDGDCAFCRRSIADWRRMTGDRIPCAAYQEVADRFPEVSSEQFEQSVVLIEPDGNIRTGAAAILRSFAYVPRRGLGWWAYRSVPGFGWASEELYRWVARNRGKLSRYAGVAPDAKNSLGDCSCAKETNGESR